jgi:hypothetical protein
MVPAMTARTFAALLALSLALFAPAASAQSQQANVVVELYTSQGCGQCPRANRLLGMFAREDDTLALTFPVGIWDYLGWHDTLARREFSDRQRVISRRLRARGRYTPQLIFNGASQESASYWDEAREAIEHARQQPLRNAPNVRLTRLAENRTVRVTIGEGARRENADVWVIAYDPGPVGAYVGSGVNQYRTIYHYNLARWMTRVGVWNGEAASYERARCAPKCAVIVQDRNGGPIIAAAFTTGDD